MKPHTKRGFVIPIDYCKRIFFTSHLLEPKNVFQDQISMKKTHPIHHALLQPTLRVHQISNKQSDKTQKGVQADGRKRKLKQEL